MSYGEKFISVTRTEALERNTATIAALRALGPSLREKARIQAGLCCHLVRTTGTSKVRYCRSIGNVESDGLLFCARHAKARGEA